MGQSENYIIKFIIVVVSLYSHTRLTYIVTIYFISCFSYLELAILPCSHFLLERPVDSLQRLVGMTRGIADPLASAYCRLYLVHRAQKLPQFDIGITYVLRVYANSYTRTCKLTIIMN